MTPISRTHLKPVVAISNGSVQRHTEDKMVRIEYVDSWGLRIAPSVFEDRHHTLEHEKTTNLSLYSLQLSLTIRRKQIPFTPVQTNDLKKK